MIEYLPYVEIKFDKNVWNDEFICLRSKMYAFRCGDDCKNKLKGISKSQSINIKFEDNYNCLFGQNLNENVIIILFHHLATECIFSE